MSILFMAGIRLKWNAASKNILQKDKMFPFWKLKNRSWVKIQSISIQPPFTLSKYLKDVFHLNQSQLTNLLLDERMLQSTWNKYQCCSYSFHIILEIWETFIWFYELPPQWRPLTDNYKLLSSSCYRQTLCNDSIDHLQDTVHLRTTPHYFR